MQRQTHPVKASGTTPSITCTGPSLGQAAVLASHESSPAQGEASTTGSQGMPQWDGRPCTGLGAGA